MLPMCNMAKHKNVKAKKQLSETRLDIAKSISEACFFFYSQIYVYYVNKAVLFLIHRSMWYTLKTFISIIILIKFSSTPSFQQLLVNEYWIISNYFSEYFERIISYYYVSILYCIDRFSNSKPSAIPKILLPWFLM